MSEKQLPEGWILTSLNNIADWGSGGTPSRKNAEYYGGDIPWIKTGDLGDKFITESSEFITEEGVKNSSAKWFPQGSVAMAMYGATIGKASILSLDATTNQACAVGSPLKSCTTSLFLYYLLANHKDTFISLGKGGAQPNISQALIKDFEISLPPLAEQKQIADTVDRLLADVASSKAELEAALVSLKQFRQSVLAAAVSGELTRDWRGNTTFSVKMGLLGDFVSIDIGHAFKSKEFTENGVRLLRGQNIEPAALKWAETKFFPAEKLNELNHLYIKEGDIVLAMDRPIISTGLKLARAKKSDLPCVLVQRVTRFKKSKHVNADYLYLLLSDLGFLNYIQPNQTGSDIPHISGKQILSYPVSLPSPTEQTKIVNRVEALFAAADEVESETQAALDKVNNLTQSILAKAFSGELTAQWREQTLRDTPELLTGDNSAASLLVRIKAEREAKILADKEAKKAARVAAKKKVS